jgi:stearoyl-CoA desaturase (delta-9 desaturase)
MFGSRRFDTIDESRNTALTAFFAVGEGWHNNHHRYQRAARNGFYWWEFDLTWYVIRAMAVVGLAWDLQSVPERVYEEARARRTRLARPSLTPAHDDAVQGPVRLDLADEAEPV